MIHLFLVHTHTINKLLHEIEKESDYYDMKLNYDKCVNLTSNRKKSSVKFKNGDLVPRKTKATYLGTILTEKADNRTEINNKIAECASTANKLKLFWNKADTTKKWKIQVFDSVIRSKLAYGLECLQLNEVERNRIDAFQMKCIRRILKIPPTFIDREWTNDKVQEAASMEYGAPVYKFSEYYQKQKFKLLGHIIRLPENDPIKQVTFTKGTTMPRKSEVYRRGKPRGQWAYETMKEAYNCILNKCEMNKINGSKQI